MQSGFFIRYRNDTTQLLQSAFALSYKLTKVTNIFWFSSLQGIPSSRASLPIPVSIRHASYSPPQPSLSPLSSGPGLFVDLHLHVVPSHCHTRWGRTVQVHQVTTSPPSPYIEKWAPCSWQPISS